MFYSPLPPEIDIRQCACVSWPKHLSRLASRWMDAIDFWPGPGPTK